MRLYLAAAFLAPPQQRREQQQREQRAEMHIQELIRVVADSDCMIEAGDGQARVADARLLLAPAFHRC